MEIWNEGVLFSFRPFVYPPQAKSFVIEVPRETLRINFRVNCEKGSGLTTPHLEPVLTLKGCLFQDIRTKDTKRKHIHHLTQKKEPNH
ncbi:hypothetical protein NPIL_207471 [Nephila pilipes]|uniref:Uncharacterized protein n=1 Tax=Nephila pilipes TaxID=299642 RepID=A0A8X6QZN5_NEPPI|nr:hypothetical protein NPIL_207471 [Nephila pilipes]